MTTDPDFDRTARAWLDDGPTELADHVLEAVFDDVHHTTQRRRSAVGGSFPCHHASSTSRLPPR